MLKKFIKQAELIITAIVAIFLFSRAINIFFGGDFDPKNIAILTYLVSGIVILHESDIRWKE